VIEQLRERFSVKHQRPSSKCLVCGSESFWRGKVAESSWFCEACKPPVVESMVGERLCLRPVEPALRQVEETQQAEPMTIRFVPMVRYYLADDSCSECRGRMLQDTVHADGSWQVRCYTCRSIKGSG
jgi:hypothetical protein